MSVNSGPDRTRPSLQPFPSPMSGSAAFQQAKALVAEWFELSPPEAENLVLTWACENKVSACALATAIVSDIHAGRPSGCSEALLRYLNAHLQEAANARTPNSTQR
jgi:hypothetical protein